jgi:glycosyltransferase involved in cell wall biosynthesis
MAPEISVVVCTYNRSDLAARAVASLVAQPFDPARHEIVVVDNASPDDTRAVVESFARRHPHVRYECETLQGLSHARNAGLRAARGAYVAYVDDDCVIPDGWLAALAEVLAARAPAICGGPALAFFDGPRPAWFRDAYGSYELGGEARPLDQQYLYGMNITFRREVIESLGGFNPAYGMVGSAIGYGEEIELQRKLRARQPDAEIFYDPRLYVYHLVRPEKMTASWIVRQRFANGEFAYRLFGGEENASVSYLALARRAALAAGLLAADVAVGLPLRDRRAYPYAQNYLYEHALRHLERLGGLFEQFRQVSRRRVVKRRAGAEA